MTNLIAQALPNLIAIMKGHVVREMEAGDTTAREVVDNLDIAWCAAERWRVEQCLELEESKTP